MLKVFDFHKTLGASREGQIHNFSHFEKPLILLHCAGREGLMQKFAIERKKDLKNRSKESFVNDLHDLHF